MIYFKNVIQLKLGLIASVFSLSFVQTSTSASWVANGPLATARYGHTATLLTNGQVLVAGGVVADEMIGSTETASAELYEPVMGIWTNATPMHDKRVAPTATLLTNGLVLVAGGLGTSSALASTELYNASTGLWETNGVLSVNRQEHTATLLLDGRVLVAGGDTGNNSSSSALASAEIYNPVTRAWAPTGSLTNTRWGHTATLLSSGLVLVAGGIQSNVLASSAELFDPNLGIWTPTGAMVSARRLHTATLLLDGRVLVAAGAGYSNNISSAELYDPTTGIWTPTGTLNFPRNSYTATLMPNGEVLVAGGDGFPNGWRSNTELYNPTTGTWNNTAALNTARGYHAATLLSNGKVMVTGGFGNSGEIFSAEIFVETPPFNLINPTTLPSGVFQFGFTNISGMSFSALAATTLSLPLSNWTTLGNVTEISPGQFQFTDPQATNSPQRFYRVRAN